MKISRCLSVFRFEWVFPYIFGSSLSHCCFRMCIKKKNTTEQFLRNRKQCSNWTQNYKWLLPPKNLDDIQFIKKVVVNTLSNQYDFGLFISINRALASSNRCLFLHDATPFWSGIYARDGCKLILFSDRYELNSSEMYSHHRCQITIL